MNTAEIAASLKTLLSELVDGAPTTGAFILNAGDAGLLRSLSRLTAEDASRSANDGATIAAHADHLRFGLSLMNRWAEGEENPWRDADWGESWRISRVDADRWEAIRAGLADEAHRWLAALAAPRDVSTLHLNGMIGSVAHLAYHLGAIRQIHRDARGPKDGESS